MLIPILTPPGSSETHDLVAGVLVGGLRVDVAVDLHVEHVELAVDGAHVAVGADVDARVGRLPPPVDLLDDRSGDEVDFELRAADRAHWMHRPSSGSAPAVICSSVPSTLHFSGSTTSSAPRAAASRTSRSAVSRLRSVSSVALS